MRGDELYTLGGKLLNFSGIDWSNPNVNYYYKYGWEYVTYWSNLYHKEVNTHGPGVEKGDVFVDLGANIGMSSVCAELMGASKIYAVEPDPEVFKALEMNRGENWNLYNCAISDYIGFIDIDLWPQNINKVTVLCTTFDEFIESLNLEKIDYLKVDIEGWEETAFDNVKQSTFDKIRKIFIEYHQGEKEKIDNFIIKFLKFGFMNYFVVLGGYQTFIYFWK